MEELLGILVVFSYLTGVSAVQCSARSYYGYYYYYIDCDEGCCGYYYSRECCAYTVDEGLIAGAVVGGILFVACIVSLVICIAKCNKKSGVVVSHNPGPAAGNIAVVNTQQQMYGAYPQPAYPPPPQYGGQPYGAYPQPYVVQQQAYGGQVYPPTAQAQLPGQPATY